MAAKVFWAVFYFSRRPSQIGPMADFNNAAIPPPIFSMPEPYTNIIYFCPQGQANFCN